MVREESHDAIEALHEMDIEVAMLTGDSEDVARAVSEELSIDTYFAEVLPDDKTKAVVSACEDVPKLVAAARQVLERDDLTLEQRREIAETLSTRVTSFDVEQSVTVERD